MPPAGGLEAAPARIAEPKASDIDGLGFGFVRGVALLIDGVFTERAPLTIGAGAAFLDGEGDPGDGGTGAGILNWLPLDELLTLLCGVNPKPPRDVLEADFALAGNFVAIAGVLPNGFAKLPSLVPGLDVPLVPFRLRLEAGRGGGPIGLSTGEKKLDRRLSLGVDGRF